MKQLACQRENINGNDTNVVAAQKRCIARLQSAFLCISLCAYISLDNFSCSCLSSKMIYPGAFQSTRPVAHPNLQDPMPKIKMDSITVCL